MPPHRTIRGLDDIPYVEDRFFVHQEFYTKAHQ